MSNRPDPKICIALGGGAARGLTHIPMMEAMDELGVRPHLIAGTSIGAMLGSGWAAGLAGSDIREFAVEYLGSIRTILSRLWSKRFANFGAVMRNGLSMQLDAMDVIEGFVPATMPRTFADLQTPIRIVSADLFTWHQVVLHDGELMPAIAASIAIPGLFKPVEFGGRTMIDGSVVNPLPLDQAARGADILIGVDVAGEPQDFPQGVIPSSGELGWRAAQIMMHALSSSQVARHAPQIYARPQTAQFSALDFWKVREILDAGAPMKEDFKRQISREIDAFTAAQQKTR